MLSSNAKKGLNPLIACDTIKKLQNRSSKSAKVGTPEQERGD